MKKLITFLMCVICGISFAQDLQSSLKAETVIAPHSNKTDVTSSAISNSNFQRDLIHVNITAAPFNATDTLKIKLEESLDNSTYVPVKGYNVVGNNMTVDASGTCLIFNEALTATTDKQFMYMGRCPYLKVICDYSGNLASAPTVLVNIIKGGKILGL